MLCDVGAANLCDADAPKKAIVGRSRHTRMSIEGYGLHVGNHWWRFEIGHFVKQVDPFNYGPIACAKILEMFRLTYAYEVKFVYHMNGIRNMVTEH